MNAANAAGTTYDGATVLLSAATPIGPGPTACTCRSSTRAIGLRLGGVPRQRSVGHGRERSDRLRTGRSCRADTDTNADPDPDPDPDTDARSDADAHADPDAWRYTDPDPDADARSDADTHADPDAWCHTDADANAGRNAVAIAHTDADANAGRNAVAIAHSRRRRRRRRHRGRLYAHLLEAEPALRLLE